MALHFKNRWILSIIIFILSFLVYIPSLGSDFVWDDLIDIQKKRFIYEKPEILSKVIPDKRTDKYNYYRPLVYVTFVVDYKIWKDNPFGYHLSNNILFAISSVVFFFFVLLILKEFHIRSKEYVSFIASLVYMLHPMHVESVSWISGRTDLICTLFFLLAFLFHILSKRAFIFTILAIFMIIFSFLSKEIAVSFPFVVLLYELIKSRKLKLKNVAILTVYFLILGLYLFLRSRAYKIVADLDTQTFTASSETNGEFFYYIKAVLVMLNAYIFYFIKLIFPFKFNFIVEVPKEWYYTVGSIFIFIFLSIWTYISLRFKSGLKAFAIIWIVLTLGPSVLVSIFQVSVTPLAERYLFLPICGFSILIAYLVLHYFMKYKSYKSSVVFILFFVLLLYFNVSRQSVWKDNVSLWESEYSKNKEDQIVRVNLGSALVYEKKVEEGIMILEPLLDKEKKIKNKVRAEAAHNIGVGYIFKSNYLEAKNWFIESANYNTESYSTYYHLALIDYISAKNLKSQELFKKAEVNLKKTIKLNKSFSMSYFLLSKIYYENNDMGKAKEYAEKSIYYGLSEELEEQAQKILDR